MRPSLKLLSITAVAGLGLMAAAFTHPQGHRFDASSLDTDHNGFVSDSELTVHLDQLFAQTDADHDGELSEPELRAFHERMQGAMTAATALAHGDQRPVMTVMSQAQFRQVMGGLASRLDANGDHRLAVAELNDAFQTGPAH